MSASEVLTALMSFSLIADRFEAARQQVVGHRELDQVDLLALDVGELLALSFRTMPSLPLE